MIDYQFEKQAPMMNQISDMSVQSFDPKYSEWVENRYEVLVKFYCVDGVKYIILDHKPLVRKE